MINAKKQRKTIEWERLELSSRKLEVPREFHTKTGIIQDINGKDLTEAGKQEKLRRGGKNTQKKYTKMFLMT